MGFTPYIAHSATRDEFGSVRVYDLWQVTAYQSDRSPALYEWRTGPDWGEVVQGADLLNDLWSEFVAQARADTADTYQ